MLERIAAVAAVAGPWVIARAGFTRDITVPYVGVPFNLIVAVAFGAVCSLGIDDEPIRPRSKFYTIMFMSVFMGCVFTALVNAVLGHFGLEMKDGTQAGVGGIVGFVMRPFLPWLYVTAKTGRWVRLVPFFRRNRE
jgi:hypothetical protein